MDNKTGQDSSSYMTYGQMQKQHETHSENKPMIAKYRESSNFRKSRDTLERAKRESSWDSAKDDEKKSPNDDARSGTVLSKRSDHSSAYDKYNLADEVGAETADDV